MLKVWIELLVFLFFKYTFDISFNIFSIKHKDVQNMLLIKLLHIP